MFSDLAHIELDTINNWKFRSGTQMKKTKLEWFFIIHIAVRYQNSKF